MHYNLRSAQRFGDSVLDLVGDGVRVGDTRGARDADRDLGEHHPRRASARAHAPDLLDARNLLDDPPNVCRVEPPFINKDGQKTRYPINTVNRDATRAANQSRGVDIVFPKSKSEFNLDF